MKKQKYNIFAIAIIGAVCLFLGMLIGTMGVNSNRDYEAIRMRLEALENEIAILETQITEENATDLSNGDEIVAQEKDAATTAEGKSATVTASQREIVWKTKSGKKYHKEDCGSLSKSSIAISLEEANAAGLEPCMKCFK